MKVQLFLLAVIFAVLLCDVSAEKPKKTKKVRKHHKVHTVVEVPPEPLPVKYEEPPVQEEFDHFEDNLVESEEKKEEVDLCATKRCGAGKVCEVINGQPECVCVPACPPETDDRRKVCTNHNETWNSDCEVYQMRCFCDHNSDACRGEQYKHIHIDYYGPCKTLPPCAEDEMADFPRRMREWLFNIMRDMADRRELSEYYLKMEREAESNYTRKWTNSAIWKWCDLDEHPHDRSVSRHELFPIRAPLLALEHCIAPFLDTCDENDDHRISLGEWGKCLELPEMLQLPFTGKVNHGSAFHFNSPDIVAYFRGIVKKDDLEERCEDLRDL